MVRLHTSYRTLAALVLLALLAYVFVSLGNWQLRRAAERTAISQTIAHGRASAPLHLQADTPDPALVPWRPASATGVWRHDLTVLLENRSHRGQPGYWVATPLVLHDEQAVLVLRGWLPRFTGDTGLPIPPHVPTPSGAQEVQGELLERVPRLFELAGWAGGGEVKLPAHLPQENGTVPIVQNLDLTDYAAATGLKLLPTVLAQTQAAQSGNTKGVDPAASASMRDGPHAPGVVAASPDTPPAMAYDWPEPSVDADQNRGYALQWFGFAAIAAIAWLFIAWRTLRRARNP